jgi:hypothetical protein
MLMIRMIAAEFRSAGNAAKEQGLGVAGGEGFHKGFHQREHPRSGPVWGGGIRVFRCRIAGAGPQKTNQSVHKKPPFSAAWGSGYFCDSPMVMQTPEGVNEPTKIKRANPRRKV